MGIAGCGRLSLKSAPSASASGSAGDVLIIGAGIAGLTAGYRLKQMGVAVRILEAQDRCGGRMRSLHFPEDQVVELGGELIDTNHENIQNLARELGLELDGFNEDNATLARDIWFFDGKRRSDAGVVEGLPPDRGKDRRGVGNRDRRDNFVQGST